jgi:hypothetical protein
MVHSEKRVAGVLPPPLHCCHLNFASAENNSQYSYTLNIRYKFNTTKSKYKGTGAGESQKARM